MAGAIVRAMAGGAPARWGLQQISFENVMVQNTRSQNEQTKHILSFKRPFSTQISGIFTRETSDGPLCAPK